MLTAQRKKLILEILARDGQLVAKQLSAELALSEDTIRRDLRELAAEGLLQRVHGGALPASPTVASLASRRTMALSEKQALGKLAASLIQPGQTVMFDGGTSNIEIIRHLPETLRFTAITHSPAIAMEFEPFPAVDVVMIGGRLYRHSMVATGALAVETISRLRADLFFLGVTGVHAEHGFTTGDMEEAAIKRALVARSAETIVLATSEKIGAVSAFLVVPVEQVSTMVVGAEAPAEKLGFIADSGVTILTA